MQPIEEYNRKIADSLENLVDFATDLEKQNEGLKSDLEYANNEIDELKKEVDRLTKEEN